MTKPLVLIVEDHPDMQMLLSAVFELEGMDTLTTNRGQKALELLRERSPDVMLLDVDLSGPLSGIDVLRTMRTDASLKDVRVVLLTGHNIAAGTPEAEHADLIILKPADNDHLVLLVRRLIKK